MLRGGCLPNRIESIIVEIFITIEELLSEGCFSRDKDRRNAIVIIGVGIYRVVQILIVLVAVLYFGKHA